MKAHQWDENGGELRKELTLEIGNNKRRNITAAIVWQPLDDAQQARFDAEVQTLLADLVRQQLQVRRSENVAQQQ